MLTQVNTIVKSEWDFICAHGRSEPSMSSYLILLFKLLYNYYYYYLFWDMFSP